ADYAIRIFPSLPKIKVCHSYDIPTKYTYVCIDCDYRIHRHSKSLDTKRKVCGRCRGEFILVNNTKFQNRETNVGNGGVVGSDVVNNKKDNQVPVFAKFVKENYSTVKKEVGSTSTHKDIMSSLSQKFKTMKVTASTRIATICLDD
uniref:SprT-like zinc ribbon domain-containing protein n=1 Tax=Romanomermis culicivorax TaxID=13658 RepID=A0A915KY17_ROMCU